MVSTTTAATEEKNLNCVHVAEVERTHASSRQTSRWASRLDGDAELGHEGQQHHQGGGRQPGADGQLVEDSGTKLRQAFGGSVVGHGVWPRRVPHASSLPLEAHCGAEPAPHGRRVVDAWNPTGTELEPRCSELDRHRAHFAWLKFHGDLATQGCGCSTRLCLSLGPRCRPVTFAIGAFATPPASFRRIGVSALRRVRGQLARTVRRTRVRARSPASGEGGRGSVLRPSRQVSAEDGPRPR